MAHGAAAFSREELLAHREWVRALAVSLTTTRDDADEVEQETWLAAISAPPSSRHSVGGWLAVVARHAAMKLRRKRSRVRRREDAAPAPAAPESPDRLVARTEAHAVVVAAVLALAEPYRTTVLLRFFEGLPVRDVASRSEVPLETARARLRRAKDLLRDALDAKFGGERRRGALMVLAAARLPEKVPITAAAAVGGAVMTGKVVAAAAVVVALVAGGVWWGTRAASAPTADRQVVVAAVPAEAPRPRPAEARPRVRQIETAPPAADSNEPAAAQPVPRVPPKTVPELLQARLSLHYEELTLDAALARFSGSSGVPIVIASECVSAAKQTPLTLRFEGVQAGTALRALVQIGGLRVTVEPDRVVVSPAGREREPAQPLVRIEPVVEPPKRLRVRGMTSYPVSPGSRSWSRRRWPRRRTPSR